MADGAFDPDFLIDLFAPFGRVTTKRMFSGHAIYRHGIVFALAIRAGLFLKADAETTPVFEAAGMPPFTYGRATGERIVASYRRMPDACFDDEDELRKWAAVAWEAARRAPIKPKRPRAKNGKPAG